MCYYKIILLFYSKIFVLANYYFNLKLLSIRGNIDLIYITGDLHGDISRFAKIRLKKSDTLIVCGDFGFVWCEDKTAQKNIKKIGNLPFKVLFVDGTHENFDLLKEYPKENFAGSVARHISGNLYQLLRGNIYNIEGKTFFAFGGGEAIDKDMRRVYNMYWDEEMPSIDEMKMGVDNLNKVGRKVDYVITHEPPAKIKGLFYEKTDSINTLNRFFDDVSKYVVYEKWFFGSIHKDRTIPPKYIGLFTSVVNLEDA